MTTSTTTMLRALGPAVSDQKINGEVLVENNPTADHLIEKHRQLSPSLALADVLKNCLTPDNDPESTPLK